MNILREPKGLFQETVRKLSEAAMSVTHHDIDYAEPEAVNEIQSMERMFTNILRGKIRGRDTTLPAPEIAARRVKLTKEGAKDAALDLVRKNGWNPGNSISLHSAVELMVAFGLMVDVGEVQCDWPNCGCCADAACRDAVTFMGTEAEIAALRAEIERLRGNLEKRDEYIVSRSMWSDFVSALPIRAAVAPRQEEAK
ncbi:hypothetical protein [Rhizobium lusitanum]|uniref:hypothetical protein n=1 Tax=Rhizobium lusitanum TaxID=293958 RepID=UPI00195A5102|nr:hypothetical protein [Rhizobium lusitanum]MBM7046084.1 hypothetical protein [Rhizobium lusitanum]